MRPHLLRFGGIGAYPGNVEINFDDLSTMGLYLIVGPTGSGKTTIFDAMTFALFGKTAGNRESMFVSDYEGRISPYVELSFSHRGRRFIAHREPAPEVGKNAPPSKQWLRELSDTDRELRTVTGIRDINAEISELLGLDADQFMQVVLLPQGRFQDFLMAKAAERKPLLQAIFGTHLYAEVANCMKQSMERLQAELEKVINALDAERISARNTIESLQGDLNIAQLPSPDEDLSELISVLGKVEAERATVAERTMAVLTKAIANETAGKTDAERFDAASKLKEIVKHRTSQQKTVEGSRTALEAHERALRILKLNEKREGLAQQLSEAKSIAGSAREEMTMLAGKLAIVGPQVTSLQSAIPSASSGEIRSSIQGVLATIDTAVEAASDLESAEKEMVDAERVIKESESTISKSTSRIKRIDTEIAKAKQQLNESSEALKKLPALETKLEKIETLQSEADIAAAKSVLERANAASQRADRIFQKADEALTAARDNYSRHLAGELATTLKPGSACAVCGSTSHPKKAPKISPVNLKKLETDQAKAMEAKAVAGSAIKDAQNALKKANDAKAKLPPATEIKALIKQVDHLSSIANFVDERAERLDELENERDTVKEVLSNAQSDLKIASNNLRVAKSRVTKLKPKVESLGTVKSINAALEVVKTLVRQATAFEKTEAKVNNATVALKEAEKSIASALVSEKFKSLDIALGAVMSDDDVAKIRLAVEESLARDTEITRLQGVIGDKPVPKVRPDEVELERLRNNADTENQEAQRAATKITHARTQLKSAKAKIEAIGPDVEAKAIQLDSVRSMTSIFTKGSGSGEDRILALEEWVQRTLFEEVCEVATEQLRILSSNRYVLTLSAEGAKAKKRASGLELYVVDGHSGKSRSVNTLSGGEQFLTSLALALALAEVVQRHAGGMELSALFIDEGFGGLDADTLDTAMDVLLKLHNTGRTVGVITHVEAMQQQLPVGIRINKTPSGSTIDVLAS
jgi:exonuclease SbcC